MGCGSGNGFGCEKLKEDPRDIKLWQAVWAEATSQGSFVFVRSSSIAMWVRVELVQAANCVVWMCPDRPGGPDEYCYEFNPMTSTYPPFMLDTTGECRFGSDKLDFRNGSDPCSIYSTGSGNKNTTKWPPNCCY